jgi:hypothetical protein
MKRFYKFPLLLLLFFIVISFSACELVMPKPEKPTIHALYIALDYYDNSYKPSLALNGTVRDATELLVAIELKSISMNMTVETTAMIQSGNSAPDPEDIHYPTKQNILSMLSTINNRMKESDIFIVYYSGHGENTGNLVLTPKVSFPYYESFPIDLFASSISNMKGTKLLIMDSCYSGNSIIDYPRLKIDQHSSTSVYDPNFHYLTAASAHQKSQEPKDDEHIHGYFTYYLLEALGWNHFANDSETNMFIDEVDNISVQYLGSLSKGVGVMSTDRITIQEVKSYIAEKLRLETSVYYLQTTQTGKGPKDMVLFDKNW